MNPLITIAMPVYNVENYVEKALNSALNQTYDNLEILVIDDKGTDLSMDIVQRVIDSHHRGKIVKIIDHIHNQGTGATKNSAIANSNGEYIFFMDSDDYITDNCIELLFNAIHSINADMAVGGYICFRQSKTIKSYHQSLNLTFSGINAYKEFYNSKAYHVETWNKLYRLSVLKDNHVYCIPSNTNEDVFFSFQLFPILRKIVTISEITYYYALRESNAATSNVRKNYIDERHVSQYVGIINEMMSIYTNSLNEHQATYILQIKANLIRRICKSVNLNENEKKEFLSIIPNLDEIKLADLKSYLNSSSLGYLGSNPQKYAKYDFLIHLPKRLWNLVNQIMNNIGHAIFR